MTFPEFVEALKDTNREWLLKEDNTIRCTKGDCPIMAVAVANSKSRFSPFSLVNWQRASNLLELDFEDACEIVDAADYDLDFILYDKLYHMNRLHVRAILEDLVRERKVA